MRKLTDKVKYKIVGQGDEAYAELYAKHKATGELRLAATCHLSVIEAVQAGTLTLRECDERGCLRYV